LLHQGWGLLQSGDHEAALAISDRLLADFELHPQTLLFAGEVHFSRANFPRSEKIAANCIQEFPEDLSGPILRCRALLAMGKLGEARDIALTMATRDVIDERQIEILVTVLSGCMEPDAAYPLCKKAVDRDPFNPAAQRRLALVCRMTGDLAAAAEAATIALKFNPHDYEMIGLRSAVQTATAEKNHIPELETMLATGCANALGGARVAYALSKECEETGSYERSFGFLQAGARFKRQTIQYDMSADIAAIDALREIFTAEAIDKPPAGHDSDEPIFILGLPRTGSTLLERILSSHSAVYAAGELRHFSGAVMSGIRELDPITDRIDLIRKTLQIDPKKTGEDYIQLTRPFTGHSPRFIDKYPPNFHNIGLIRKSLPEAKIIHVRRAPMDACYAIYKFLFNEAYPWSYDLDEIARYYIAYRRLMDHWHSIFPGEIIDIAYEDLVEDVENTAKGLIAKLGLEWEPECLRFYENEAAAMTGSAAQVRQKLYSSSVGRWRNYQEQLQPLANSLANAEIDPYSP
jgi:hypothetical protein